MSQQLAQSDIWRQVTELSQYGQRLASGCRDHGIRSGPFRRDDNHPGVLDQLDRGIEWTNHAILNDPFDGQRATVSPAQIDLNRQRWGVRRQLGRWDGRLRGDLLVERPAPGAPLINIAPGSHFCPFSMRRDYEDRRFAEFAENIGNLVVLSIISPEVISRTAAASLMTHSVFRSQYADGPFR
jgi:hypothetical protein